MEFIPKVGFIVFDDNDEPEIEETLGDFDDDYLGDDKDDYDIDYYNDWGYPNDGDEYI